MTPERWKKAEESTPLNWIFSSVFFIIFSKIPRFEK